MALDIWKNMKASQAGVDNDTMGDMNVDEIQNAISALRSMFTSPTGYNDLVIVLSQLDQEITTVLKPNERQKRIADQIDTIQAYREKIIERLKIVYSELSKQNDMAATTKTNIMQSIGRELGITAQHLTAKSIGKSAKTSDVNGLAAMKRAYKKWVTAHSDDFGTTIEEQRENIERLFQQIDGFRGNDDLVGEFGVSEINNMIARVMPKGTIKPQRWDAKGGSSVKAFAKTANEKITTAIQDRIKETSNVYAGIAAGRQSVVEKFYETATESVQRVLKGHYLEDRVQKQFGENATASKMAKQVADGEENLYAKLATLAQKLAESHYEMFLAQDENGSKMRIGVYHAKNKGDVFVNGKVNWDKMATFDLGMDQDGIFEFNGMPSINRLRGHQNRNGEGYFTTAIEDSIENILQGLGVKNNGEKRWIQKTLDSGDISELQRAFKLSVRNAFQGTPAASPYKILDSDYRKGLYGSGSSSKLAIGKGIIDINSVLDEIIRDNKLQDLVPDRAKQRSAEAQREELKRDLYQIILAEGLGGQQAIDDMILSNADFDYLTKNPRFQAIRKQLTPWASLGINMGSISENSASHFLIGTAGAETFSPMGSLVRGSDRSWSQVRSTLRKMNKSKIAKSTRLASSEGLRRGVDYNGTEMGEYNIGFITEQQVAEAYKEFRKQSIEKMRQNNPQLTEEEATEKFIEQYGASPLSVLNDSGIFSQEIQEDLDSYRHRTHRMSVDEYTKIFDQYMLTHYDWTPEEINQEIARTRFSLSKNSKLNKIIQDDDEYIFDVDEFTKMVSGTKLLNMATGERYTGLMASKEYMDILRKKAGYNESDNIQLFRSKGPVKAKNLPGILEGRLRYILGQAKDAQAIQNAMDELKQQKALLSDWLEYNEKEGRFVDKFDLAKELKTNPETYAERFGRLFNEVEQLGQKLGVQRHGALSYDEETGQISLGESPLIISSGINQADIYHYDGSVGYLDDDEDYASRHSFSDKERAAIKRQIGVSRARTGRDYSGLASYLSRITEPSQKIIDEYEKQEQEVIKAIQRTSYSGTDDREKSPDGISIGYGSDFDLDLSKDGMFNRMVYTDGGIRETDFVNSIYAKIAEQQRIYRENHGLSEDAEVPVYIDTRTPFGDMTEFDDGGKFIFGGTRVYLPQEQFVPYKKGDNNIYDMPYYNSELSALFSRIIEAGQTLSDENKTKISDSALDLVTKMYDDVYNKKGTKYKKRFKNSLGNSNVSTSNAVNIASVLSVLDENTDENLRRILTSAIQMNRADVEAMMAQGEMSDEDYLEILKLNYEDIFGEGEFDKIQFQEGLSSAKKFAGIRKQILDALTIGSKAFNNRIANGHKGGLRAMFHRYPSTNGLDEKFTDIFIDNSIESGFSKAGLGLLRSVNGDSDGDHIYAALTTFGKGITKQAFKDLDDLQKTDAAISEAVAYVEALDILPDENKPLAGQKDLLALADDKADVAGSILAKMNKQKVGTLSNISTAIRNILTEAGLDEISVGTSKESQKNAAQAIITRAVFESMEQDAISAKKVEDRIIARAFAKNNGKEIKDTEGNVLTGDEARKELLSRALTELDDLTQKFYDSEIMSSPTAMTDLIKKLQGIGVLGEDEDVFSGRIGSQVMATIQQMKYGNEILQDMFGEDAITRMFEWDENGHIVNAGGKPNLGKFTFDVIKNATNNMNAYASSAGRKMLERATWNKYVPGKISAESNAGYTLSRVNGTNDDYSQAPEVLAHAWDKATQAVNAHRVALEAESQVELKKIQIANSEGKEISKLAGDYNGLSIAVGDAGKATGNLNSTTPRIVGLGFGGKNNTGLTPMGVTTYLSKLIPYDKSSLNLNEATNAINKIAENDEEVANLSKLPNDKARMDSLKIADPKIFQAVKSGYVKTETGTMAHKVAELIIRAQRILKDTTHEINSMADIEKIIQNNSDSVDIQSLSGLMEEYQKAKDKMTRGMSILGYDKQDIEYALYDSTYMGEQGYKVLKSATGTGQVLSPEFKLHMSAGSNLLKGIIDAMSIDGDGILNIFDYKNKGEIGASEAAQLVIYEEMMKRLQEELKTLSDRGELDKAVEKYNVDKDILEAIIKASGFRASIIQNKNGSSKIYSVGNIGTVLRDRILSGEETPLTESEKDELVGKIQESAFDGAAEDSAHFERRMQHEQLAKKANVNELISEQIELYTKLAESIAHVQAYEESLSQSEKENAKKELEEIENRIKEIDAMFGKEGEYEQFANEYAVRLLASQNIGSDGNPVITEEQKKKAIEDFEKYRQKAVTTSRKSYIDTLKEENRIQEQIAVLTKQMQEAPANDIKRGYLNDQLDILRKQLAYLTQSAIVLDEQNKQLVIGTGEHAKRLQLTEEEFAELQQQKNILNASHQTQMARIATPEKQVGLIDQMLGNFKRQITYMSTQSVVYKLIGFIQQTFKQLVQTIKELDKAMVDLQIASGYTRKDMLGALSSYTDIGKEMGRTTKDVLSAANDWLRAGYTIEEANSLIRNSMKLSTLGMIDSQAATENLISTMRGWKLTASEVSEVVDELTALDMKAAISAGELATAMSKGNASAMLAGSTRQNFEAYITTAADISQQSAETVGTAMKTLFARYSNVRAGKFASNYGVETDDNEEYTALNDVETVLNKVGIQTRDSVAQFRNIDDVLEDIASKWGAMDNVTKNAVTTALGGTRQREILNILLSNWDEVEKMRNVALNSNGTADQKMENYTSSIEAAQNRLTASIEAWVTGQNALFGAISYTDILTGIYDLLSGLVDNVSIILALLTPYLAMKQGTKILHGLTSGIGKYGNFISGPGEAFQSWLANRRQIAEDREAHGISWWDAKVANIRQSRMADLDKEIHSTIASMQKNNVRVNNSYITAEDALDAANFFTNNDNKFSDLVKLTSSDWDSVADAMDNGDIARWLNARKNVNKVKDTDLFTESGLEDPDQINYGMSRKIFNYEAELMMAQEQEAQARRLLAQKLGISSSIIEQGDDAIEQAILARLRNTGALDENTNELATDSRTIRVRARVAQNKNVHSKIGMIPGQNESASKSKVFAPAISAVGGMMGTTGGALIGNQIGGAGGAMTGMILGQMAPMLGSAIGSAFSTSALAGPLGAAVAGALVLGIGGAMALIPKEKTVEELLEESKKANETLQKHYDKINELQESLANNKNREGEWYKLIKGVDPTTGKNISLNNEEWASYQEILSSLIDANDGLYASYDEQGNIVAKTAGHIADLNSVMSDTINLIKDQTREEYYLTSHEKNDDDQYTAGVAIYAPVKDAYDKTIEGYKNFTNNFGGLKIYQWYTDIPEAKKAVTGEDYLHEHDVKVNKEAPPTYSWGFNLYEATKDKSPNDYIEYSYDGGKTFVPLEKFGDAQKDISQTWMIRRVQDESRGYLPTSYRYAVIEQESKKKFQQEYNEAQKSLNSKNLVNVEFNKQLSKATINWLKGTEGYSKLDAASQSYINNIVSQTGASAFDGNGNLRNSYLSFYELYGANWAENMGKYLETSNGKTLLSSIANFDEENATYDQIVENERNKIKLQVEGGGTDEVSSKATFNMLKAQGYTTQELVNSGLFVKDGDLWHLNNLSNEDMNSALQQLVNTGGEYNNRLNKLNGMGFSLEELKKLTKNQLNSLFMRRSDIDASSNAADIIAKLQEITLGASGTTSEYASSLLSTLKGKGLQIKNTDDLLKLINGDYININKNSRAFVQQTEDGLKIIKQTKDATGQWRHEAEALYDLTNDFSYQQLSNIADFMGTDVKTILQNMSFFSDIDAYGHTTTTVSEMEKRFASLKDILEDVGDNGRLSISNLQTVIDEFGNTLLPILDRIENGDYSEFQNAVKELYGFKGNEVAAAIKTALDENSQVFEERIQNLNQFTNGEAHISLTPEDRRILLAFGNTSAFVNISDRVRNNGIIKDEDGTEYLNSTYLLTGDNVGVQTFEKDLWDFYGIDLNQSYDARKQALEQILKTNFHNAEIDSLTYEEMLTRLAQYGGTEYFNYKAQEMSIESEIKSLEIYKKNVEDESRKKDFENNISRLDAEWQRGTISYDTYISTMQEFMKSEDATPDKVAELTEKVEEAKYDKISKDFKNGAMAASEFRGQLAELIHLNTADSSDYSTMVEAYLSSFDQELSQLQARNNLIQDYDHEAKALNYQEQYNILKEKEAALIAAGRRDTEIELNNRKAMIDAQKNYESELLKSIEYQRQILDAEEKLLGDNDFEAKRAIAIEQAKNDEAYLNQLMENQYTTEEQILQASEKYLASQKKILDIEKQRLEHQIKLAEDYFGDYDTIANYEINLLQRRQEVIRDYYDEEISKLEEANNQKQRSIELTKLEMELENARKEKSMVYVAGVGFQAQANKARVKEAKQNLDNYLEKQHIEDLKTSEQKEINLVQERIDDWNDIKEIVSFTRSEAEATAAVQNLIDTGFLRSNSTIQSVASEILGNVQRGMTGQIEELGTKFDNVAKDYIANKGDLQKFIDNYDTEVQKIISNIDEKWADQEIGVPAIKGKMDDITTSVNNLVDNFFVNDEQFKTSYNQACRDLSTLAGKKFTATFDTSWIDSVNTAINGDKKRLAEIQASLSEIQKKIPDIITVDPPRDNPISKQEMVLNYNVQPRQTVDEIEYIRGTDGLWYKMSDVKQKGYGVVIPKGTRGYEFASGIEKGPVNFTGLAQLHGSPSNPEYVLNNKQAYTLLRNLSTMTLNPYQAPSVASYRSESASATTYTFGDIYLPNVQKPDEFFDELLRVTKTQFGSIKTNYQHS